MAIKTQEIRDSINRTMDLLEAAKAEVGRNFTLGYRFERAQEYMKAAQKSVEKAETMTAKEEAAA